MTKLLNAPIILVADDEATIRTNLKLLLESEGYQVREAADGGTAAHLLQDPDVVLCLLDLKMPVVDGMDVLRGHADRLEETPVIVITAYGGSKAAIEAMKHGAYDYITKPFDFDEVLFSIRRALTQRTLVAQVQALSRRGRPAQRRFQRRGRVGGSNAEHVASVQGHWPGGADARAGADRRRERHRQGAGRRAIHKNSDREATVHQSQQRRPQRDAPGK